MWAFGVWAGLEVAAYVHDKAQSVAVVGTSKVALQHVFGSQLGARIMQVEQNANPGTSPQPVFGSLSVCRHDRISYHTSRTQSI